MEKFVRPAVAPSLQRRKVIPLFIGGDRDNRGASAKGRAEHFCHSERSRGISNFLVERNSKRCLGPSRTGVFARHDKATIAERPDRRLAETDLQNVSRAIPPA